jgi:hypothetical protein
MIFTEEFDSATEKLQQQNVSAEIDFLDFITRPTFNKGNLELITDYEYLYEEKSTAPWLPWIPSTVTDAIRFPFPPSAPISCPIPS